jgi:S-adenosylmethionine-diacylglycerol 3-amino-3-carboxypropyl transferase
MPDMLESRVQFAIVREDPRVELAVLRACPCAHGLLIASGGCTALTLAARHPSLDLTLLDPNPAQLALVEAKIDALGRADSSTLFNLGDPDPKGLNQCGNFEKLFRGLRHFICEMGVPETAIESAFRSPEGPSLLLQELRQSPYWPVAFELYFSDALLRTMFGDDAVQYADPGSYPDYFRQVMERGLAREDAWKNPFLHHILLGRYLEEHPPDWLPFQGNRPQFTTICGSIDAVEDLGIYDFIGLSNILDWMSPGEVQALLERLLTETTAGTVVVWRQLNNHRDLAAHLSSVFSFDSELETELHCQDRSLFYSSLHIGRRERA